MLRWILIAELALLAAVGALAVRRRIRRAARAPRADGAVAPPFAVRWTAKPLGRLADPRVRIGKSAHVMTVFDGRRAVKSYRVGLGTAPGHKRREGDRRTPVGAFYICTKNPESRYTRSLGLSYPNEADAARGLRDGLIRRDQHDAIVRAARRRQRPPWDTPLGGEIMIHGRGAGRDWTLGCVAVEDAHIRELFEVLPIGTPVTILP